jgi:hypothetical protein
VILGAAPLLFGADPTYSNSIAKILNENCVSCHRPGEIGPMPLRTYAEVRPWAKAIAASAAQRRMPPWHADPAVGHFQNDRRLKPEVIAALQSWARNGAPEGDPKLTPAPPQFTEGWAIGKPDLTFSIPEERVITPTGPDEYVKIVVDPKIDRDLWVKAVELRPGNRRVVHHAHVFLMLPPAPGAKRNTVPSPFIKSDGLQVIEPSSPVIDDGCGHPNGGYMIGREHGDSTTLLASFVPGMTPDVWPDGVAKKIPAGAKFLFDIHYSKVTGKEERDRTSVGLVLADGPPKVALERFEASNFYFSIPPGAEAHEVTACVNVKDDIDVLGLLGHMHYRGKAFRMDALLPDGKVQPLLNVPRYDFDWQEMYRFAKPVGVPQGSRIRITAWFDNSANNRANPDPKATVRWGEHTRTEMMDGWVEFVKARPAP